MNDQQQINELQGWLQALEVLMVPLLMRQIVDGGMDVDDLEAGLQQNLKALKGNGKADANAEQAWAAAERHIHRIFWGIKRRLGVIEVRNQPPANEI